MIICIFSIFSLKPLDIEFMRRLHDKVVHWYANQMNTMWPFVWKLYLGGYCVWQSQFTEHV